MQLQFLASFLALTLIALCGCGKNDESTKEDRKAQKRNVLGVTCGTSSILHATAINRGMEEEAAKQGYELMLLTCEGDVSKQKSQIKTFINQGISAIAISPVDGMALAGVVREANRNGIPVFTFDTRIEVPSANIVTHIGTDNVNGGELAAEAMIAALDKNGGEVVIVDDRAAEACIERVEGFKKAIDSHNAAKGGERIEVVAELPGGNEENSGLAATEDALQSYPGLEGIFAVNHQSGLGALRAIREAGRLSNVTVVAFDNIPAGKNVAAVAQDSEQIGRETVRTIIAHLSGEEVGSSILIPATLKTQTRSEIGSEP